MHGTDRLGRTHLLGLFLLLGLAAAVWSSAVSVSAQGGLPTRPAVHTIATLHQGLRVYWYESSEDGGSAITGYDVEYRSVGTEQWTDAGHTGTSQPAVITGLRFNTSYEVRVRARNANGAGPWSSVESRRTSRDDGKPDRPWPPTLEPGDGRIEVSWTAPAYTGGRAITGYHVRYTTDNAATWRTWAPGGNRLITGTTTTITGLNNGVTVGVAVGAINVRGQGLYSLPFSEAAPAPPLTLSLESSRALCTANTLTELSWAIAGGVPPYTLTIEGEKVDPGAESHRVNCGPLATDPLTGDPLVSQKKMFSASVRDGQGGNTSTRVDVKLAPPLPAPVELRYGSHVGRVVISWRQVIDTQTSPALLRHRPIEDETWRYALAQSHSIRAAHTLTATTDAHTAAVAAMRHKIEAETPTALQWSEPVRYAGVALPQDLKVTATHDAVTVSWKKQPHAGGQMPFVKLASDSFDGFRAKRVFEETGQHGRHEVEFRHVPPETTYTITVSMTDLGDSFTAATKIIRTLAPPPGWTPPLRGPQNVQTTATHNSLAVTWQPPHDDAYLSWSVQVIEDHSGREINHRWFNNTMAWTIRSARNGDPLRPGLRYRIIVRHLTLDVSEAEVVVTTAPTVAAAQATVGAAADEYTKSVLLPFFPSWPVAIDHRYAMTDDPFEWRGARYHAGLDIGERGGAGGIAAGNAGDVSGDAVYAVADGMLRLFSYQRGHTVLYCHDDRLALHERFHASSDGWGSAWWDGSKIYIGTKNASGDAFCDDVASFAGGMVALIAHTLSNGQGVVTKYAHLLGVAPKVLAGLVKDSSCLGSSVQPCEVDSDRAVRVVRGQQIGTVGASFYGGSDNEFYDDHVHFEIRSFAEPLVDHEEWYLTAARCGDSRKLTTGVDCPWNGRDPRYMKSVLEAEAYLPPLPASYVPRDSGGRPGSIVATNANRHVFEIVSAALADTSSSAVLDTTLSMALWRPAFYSLFDGQKSRLARGIASTGPGVDRYHTNAACALLPDDLLNDPIISNLPELPDLPDLPTIDVRTGMAILNGDPNRMVPAGELPRESRVLRLRLNSPCESSKVTVRASNAHWERRYPDQILDRADQNIELRDPSALITWSAELEASEDEQTLTGQQLAGNAINLYTFAGHRGHSYDFCTIPPAPKSPVPGICTNERSATNTAELLLLGPTGPVTGATAGADGLTWTVPDGAPPEATYTLVVRRRDRERQANPSPANYSYALRYTVPPVDDCGSGGGGVLGQSGASAVAAAIVCQPPRPTDLSVTKRTSTSLTLTWEGVDGATVYQLKAIKTSDCEADQTPEDQLKRTTETSYTFDLVADTSYTLCVRADREIGPGPNKLVIMSAWESESARTLAANQPPPPTNLTVSDVTDASAKLKWKASATATDYAVRLDGVVVDDSIGNVTEYSFSGLTARTAHVLSVAAKNANAESGFAELTLLVPPSSLSAAATHSSIRLTWTVDANATAADVRLGAAGSVEDADERTSHTFDQDIRSSTSYTLYVRARNTQGPSAWASTTATAKARPVSPSQPTTKTCPDGSTVAADAMCPSPDDDDANGDDDDGASGDDDDDTNGDGDDDANGDDDDDDDMNGDDDANGDDDDDMNGDGDDSNGNGDPPPTCSAGQERVGGACVPKCAAGEVRVNGQCTTPNKCLTEPKPADRSWMPHPPTSTVDHRWVPVFFGPQGCVQYQERRTTTTTTTYRLSYVCENKCWVSKVSTTRTTSRSGWSRTGSSQPCIFGASGSAASATLGAGDYELQWGDQRIALTVPAGASVTLRWREQQGGGYIAVLSVKGGAELVVRPKPPSGTVQAQGQAQAAGTSAPSDPTLQSIAASLRDPTKATSSAVSTTTQCAVAERSADDTTSVDLDAVGCAIVRQGGEVTVQANGESRSFALTEEQEWLIVDATESNAQGTAAVTLLHIASGGHLTVSLADGAELSRRIPDGQSDLAALFDAMLPKVPVSSQQPSGR